MVWRCGLVLATAALLSGCAVAPLPAPAQVSAPCSAQDISDACLLHDARKALEEIENLPDWIAVGSEYAHALYMAGRREEADALMQSAWRASEGPTKPAERSTARITLAKVWADVGEKEVVLDAVEDIRAESAAITQAAKRQDIRAAAIALMAKAGQPEEALREMLALPQDSETEASFKARGLREIAAYAAKAGDFDTAGRTLDQITMGLVYYRNVARSDVAGAAMASGHTKLAEHLLDEAAKTARRDPDGYFAAGALRDVAVVFARHEDTGRAEELFVEALLITNEARSKQEQARAISRVVTAMADVGLTDSAQELLTEALSIAAQDEREVFRDFARYEIAGSAAFAGQFALAQEILAVVPEKPFGSATSLRSVILRDIAWGHMRAGEEALAASTARSIPTPRERVQALARLVLLRSNSGAEAPARYL